MAEKAVLVDKLPPVKSHVASTPSPTAPEPVAPKPAKVSSEPIPPAFQLTAGEEKASSKKTASTKVESKKVTLKKAEPEILLADAQKPALEAEARTEEPSTAEITITPFQKATHTSFIFNLAIFGVVGVFFLSRGLNKKLDVRHTPMISYGAFLFALAFVYFYMKGVYTDFLWQETDAPALAIRSLSWMILAPVLFLLIANLLRTGKKEKQRFLMISGLAVLLFGSIGVSCLQDIGQGIRVTFTILSFLASIGACLLLFFAYRDFSDDLNPHVEKGFTIIVGVIAGGWFLYPWLNAASLFFNAPSVFLFLLNLVDLGLMAGVTYGVYESTAKVSEKIAVKPKAPMAPAAAKPKGPKPKAPAPRKAS